LTFERERKGIDMLEKMDVAANIAVKDMDRARRFYEDTLGLIQIDKESDQVIVFRSGTSTILVYKSQYAGSNKATAATWTVGEDVEGVVRSLEAKGVAFEHYDMPGTTREGDIHVSGSMKVAWFKDPDGNILCVVNGKHGRKSG
jgi:catechol 2,3-dioxygenase-like lactoylglutathione lyase family enzyme